MSAVLYSTSSSTPYQPPIYSLLSSCSSSSSSLSYSSLSYSSLSYSSLSYYSSLSSSSSSSSSPPLLPCPQQRQQSPQRVKGEAAVGAEPGLAAGEGETEI